MRETNFFFFRPSPLRLSPGRHTDEGSQTKSPRRHRGKKGATGKDKNTTKHKDTKKQQWIVSQVISKHITSVHQVQPG